MLTYSFEGIACPLYEHLARCLKKDIESGRIAAGEKLPSKRAFAENLGVSTVTVEGAYRQLALEGYVHSEPKRGWFAEKIGRTVPESRPLAAALPLPEPPAPPAFRWDLSGGHADTDAFPFSAWGRLARETLSEKRLLMRRSPSAGVPELRRAIAKHLAAFRGMAADPAQIVVGAGSEYLYGLAIQLLGRDRLFCLENPGYAPIAKVCAAQGAAFAYAGLDASGLIPGELRATGAAVAHVSPTHQFPTGATMPAARRYELLAWASEAPGRFIIEDDYDSEFGTDGRPVPALQSIDAEGRVIYMNTFTKSLASTVRLAYMVLPPELLEEYERKLSFLACTVSNFEQHLVAKFLERGYFERHLNRMRTRYAKRREAVLEAIRTSPLGPRCEAIANRSGLHFLLKIETEAPDAALSSRLAELGIRLTPLSAFCAGGGARPEHLFLIAYVGIDPEAFPDALRLIAREI